MAQNVLPCLPAYLPIINGNAVLAFALALGIRGPLLLVSLQVIQPTHLPCNN